MSYFYKLFNYCCRSVKQEVTVNLVTFGEVRSIERDFGRNNNTREQSSQKLRHTQ